MRTLNRCKWVFICLLVLCVLLIVGFVCRAPLLRGVANEWVVNEPLSKADVIVVLGGGPDTRPFEAARLFHLGLAPKILLMDSKHSPSAELGLIPSEAELGRDILLKENVPTNAIFVTTDIVTNSFDESIALRNWAKTNIVQRAIIPTDPFHTRRVRWLYHKELKGTGIQVEIEAVPVNQYDVNTWWQHEEGVVAFQNEVLKFAYYRVKY